MTTCSGVCAVWWATAHTPTSTHKLEPLTPGRSNIRYDVLEAQHVPAVTECLIDVWVGQNVIMNALAITQEEFRPLASKRVQDGVRPRGKWCNAIVWVWVGGWVGGMAPST